MSEITRRDVLRASAIAAVGVALAAAEAPEPQTKDAEKLKVVVAGAHPEDSESGCGGTMALYAGAGHDVVSMYLTRGEAGVVGMSYEEAGRSAEDSFPLASRPSFDDTQLLATALVKACAVDSAGRKPRKSCRRTVCELEARFPT